jgi:hypothetical protein
MIIDLSQIPIDLLVNGIFPLIGVWLGYFVTKNSHIFQRSYDRKSDLLIDLYKEVVKLEFALKKYVHFTGAETGQYSIERKIEELNNIKKDFNAFQNKFWEVEIILDNNIVEKINQFRETYISITSKLVISNISQQQRDYKQSFDGWDKSFELVRTDLAEIKEGLKSEFKRALEN